MDAHGRSQRLGCGITKLEPFLSLLSRFPGAGSVSGSLSGAFPWATCDLGLPPVEGAHPAFPRVVGVLQEVLQESRETKGMALKIMQGFKKKSWSHSSGLL